MCLTELMYSKQINKWRFYKCKSSYRQRMSFTDCTHRKEAYKIIHFKCHHMSAFTHSSCQA